MALLRFLVIKAISKTLTYVCWGILLKWFPTVLLAIFALVRPITTVLGAAVMAVLPREVVMVKTVLDSLSGAVTFAARLNGPTAEAIARSFGIDGLATGLVVSLFFSFSITAYLAYRERRAIARWFHSGERTEPTFD